jgi:hypothetical protein
MLDKLTLDPKRPRYFQGYGETHNWTHKYALWELPYINVMHQEHNMGFPGKTKDNMKARQDLAKLCNCLSQISTEERSHVVNEGVKIPRWLCYWLETFREYDDMDANWVEES